MSMIKGSEVKLTFTTSEGGVAVPLSDVVSASFEIGVKMLEQGLLGEVSNRVDEIYEKTTGSVEFRIESSGYLDFLRYAATRSQTRTAVSSRFDMSMRFNFGGTRRLAMFRDLKFGPLSLEVGERTEFLGSSFDWQCSDPPRFL